MTSKPSLVALGETETLIGSLRTARAKDLRTIRSMARALRLARVALQAPPDPFTQVIGAADDLKRAADDESTPVQTPKRVESLAGAIAPSDFVGVSLQGDLSFPLAQTCGEIAISKAIHPPPAALSIQVAEDLPSIEALEDEWNELERRTPEATGFQSFWWCRACLASSYSLHVHAPKPYVIVVRERGKAVWLLPLQIERRFGIRWARGLGQPVTQYADALAVASPKRAIWRAEADAALLRLEAADVISMVQVRADGVLANVPGRSVVTKASEAPFIDLAASMDGLRPSRSMRRRHRLFARSGAITFDMIVDADARRSAVRHALDLKAEWLRVRHLHRSNFLTPAARYLMDTLAACEKIEVCALRSGPRVAAIEIGFVAGDVYRSLLSAYDLQDAYGSPGHLVTRFLIERCSSRGLRTLDLLAPSEPYKRALASRAEKVVAMHQPLTMIGRIGMIASLNLRRPFYAAREWRDRILVAASSIVHLSQVAV